MSVFKKYSMTMVGCSILWLSAYADHAYFYDDSRPDANNQNNQQNHNTVDNYQSNIKSKNEVKTDSLEYIASPHTAATTAQPIPTASGEATSVPITAPVVE